MPLINLALRAFLTEGQEPLVGEHSRGGAFREGCAGLSQPGGVKTSVQHIMINLIVHGIDLVDVIKNLQTRGFTNRQETGGDGQEALSEHHCYWQWY